MKRESEKSMAKKFKVLITTILIVSLLLSGCNSNIKKTAEGETDKSSSVSLLPEGDWQELPDDDTSGNAKTQSSQDSSLDVSDSNESIDSSEYEASGDKFSTVGNKQNPTLAPTIVANPTTTPIATMAPKPTPVAGTLEMVYTPKYATGFKVEYYYGGARIIATDIKATANTPEIAQRVLILPIGAIEPINKSWDKKITGVVERTVALSSAHAGHFENLKSIAQLKGTSIDLNSCQIPLLKSALESGETVFVGSGATADKELIISLNPQTVFVGGMNADLGVATKLEESGIFCFYFGDFAETNFMGRAQWIEVIGTFIGKGKAAQDFIKNSESEINKIILRANQIQNKPNVLWFTHSSSAPHWNVRTVNDYVNSIVSFLGGKLYFPEGSKENSVKMSNEAFLPFMMNADKIVFGVSLNSYKAAKDITYFNKEGQIDFSQSAAFKNNQCFVVGYDWAQDTANALEIVQSTAFLLYPKEFPEFVTAKKIIPFKVD